MAIGILNLGVIHRAKLAHVHPRHAISHKMDIRADGYHILLSPANRGIRRAWLPSEVCHADVIRSTVFGDELLIFLCGLSPREGWHGYSIHALHCITCGSQVGDILGCSGRVRLDAEGDLSCHSDVYRVDMGELSSAGHVQIENPYSHEDTYD